MINKVLSERFVKSLGSFSSLKTDNERAGKTIRQTVSDQKKTDQFAHSRIQLNRLINCISIVAGTTPEKFLVFIVSRTKQLIIRAKTKKQKRGDQITTLLREKKIQWLLVKCGIDFK